MTIQVFDMHIYTSEGEFFDETAFDLKILYPPVLFVPINDPKMFED